jgi:hypothetical protein
MTLASLLALLLAVSVADAAGAVAARCDSAALRGLRYELGVAASRPWSHASLVFDVTNVVGGRGGGPRNSTHGGGGQGGAVNLAGVQLQIGFALRVGELTSGPGGELPRFLLSAGVGVLGSTLHISETLKT